MSLYPKPTLKNGQISAIFNSDDYKEKNNAISGILDITPNGAIALQDIGANTTLPFVVLAMGQSNMVGRDNLGSKTVQPNIFCTNDFINPTAIVPAVFGTAPIWNSSPSNLQGASAANSCNNQAIQFANYLRLSGMLPSTRPIIVVFNCVGGQSITQWVGSGTSSPYWVSLVSALSLVTSSYSGATINHVLWAQGESDNNGASTSYNTRSTYLSGFGILVSQLRSLSMWQSGLTTIAVTELGTFYNNPQQDRNDALYSLREGLYDPLITFVSGTGLLESTQQPLYHYDGNGLVTLGQRHFQAWAQACIYGSYYDGTVSSIGSSQVYNNSTKVVNGGTLNISIDNLRSGSFYVNCQGTSTLNIPFSGYCLGSSIFLNLTGAAVINAIAGSSTAYITPEESASTVTTYTTTYGVTATIQLLSHPDGTWHIISISPRIGQTMAYVPATGSTVLSGLVTLNANAVKNAFYQVSNASPTVITLPTPTSVGDGAEVTFYMINAGSTLQIATGLFIYTNGQFTTSSYNLPSQGIVTFISLRLHWFLKYDSSQALPFTSVQIPTTGTTITIPNGVGIYNLIVNPAGTLANLTINLPAYCSDGAVINIIFYQAITTLSWGGISSVSVPSSAISGSKVTLTYSFANSLWYSSSGTTKTFIIDHPLNTNKLLIHGCLEGPESGVYYRGETEIYNNKSILVSLPDYTLNFMNFTVHITKIMDVSDILDDNIDIDTENSGSFCCSKVVDRKFKIFGKNGKYHWVVYATRELISVEPDKNEIEIKGIGPYKYP